MGLPLQLYVAASPLLWTTLTDQLVSFQVWKGRDITWHILKTEADKKFQGSLFGPYTPLQQLDVLADYGTKSYMVGSTNSLLLQQRDRYSDILINVCILHFDVVTSFLAKSWKSSMKPPLTSPRLPFAMLWRCRPRTDAGSIF